MKSLSRSSITIEPSTLKSNPQNKMLRRSESILSTSQPRNFSSPCIHSSQEKIVETEINSDGVADYVTIKNLQESFTSFKVRFYSNGS